MANKMVIDSMVSCWNAEENVFLDPPFPYPSMCGSMVTDREIGDGPHQYECAMPCALCGFTIMLYWSYSSTLVRNVRVIEKGDGSDKSTAHHQ